MIVPIWSADSADISTGAHVLFRLPAIHMHMHGKMRGTCPQLSCCSMHCRHFEEIQGRLEASTEQCSAPLALLPDIQVIMPPSVII